MKLDILLQTHKRPKLFTRCINSALRNIPPNVHIIVNNNSCDITEIEHPQVTYFYEPLDAFVDRCKFLVSISKERKSDYIYFLEDDDYLPQNFYGVLDVIADADIYTGGYLPYDCRFKPSKSGLVNFELNRFDFHGGQAIYKTSIWEMPKYIEHECDGNCISTDYLVYYELAKNHSVVHTNRLFYIQTDDGKDNMSMPEHSDLSKCSNCKYRNTLEL